MIRKFNFDYDKENDSLFVYDPKSKTKNSIEIDDIIIDFNNKKKISGIELLNASKFFRGLKIDSTNINKEQLTNIQKCNVEIIYKNNFIMIKFFLKFSSKKELITPIYVPNISKSSPALA
jgi:uncharacterized protein YuzE